MSRDGASAGHGTEAEPVVVDARGLRCPLPVVRLAAAARDLPPGAHLVVWSTDPAARHDVPAWARMRGHRVVAESTVPATARHGSPDQDQGAVWAITVELGPPRS